MKNRIFHGLALVGVLALVACSDSTAPVGPGPDPEPVDEAGNPYADPSYTFADLGNLVIRGDHEVLQSAIFDLE